MARPPARLAVLFSGAGSTLVNLQDHIARGEVPAEIVVVISSRRKALGIDRARALGLDVEILARRDFERGSPLDVEGYSEALARLIEPRRVDLVVLAGFMTRLGRAILDRWPVVNVHPALLPSFGGDGFHGRHVHEAVIAAGVKVSGATVHFADAGYDSGPIILQEAVPVLEDDTPDTLAARVQAAERRIYPLAIRLFAEGRLAREGRRVRILPEAVP